MLTSFATLGKFVAAAAIMTAPTMITQSASPSSAIAVRAPQGMPIKQTATRERHREIRKAITALERAKTDLKRADHDFGGHRVAALAACDRAIEQLKLALQYDRK